MSEDDDEIPLPEPRKRRKSRIEDLGATPEKQLAAVVEYVQEVREGLRQEIQDEKKDNAARWIQLRKDLFGDDGRGGLRSTIEEGMKQLHSISQVGKLLAFALTIAVTISLAAAPFIASAVVERSLIQHGILKVSP